MKNTSFPYIICLLSILLLAAPFSSLRAGELLYPAVHLTRLAVLPSIAENENTVEVFGYAYLPVVQPVVLLPVAVAPVQVAVVPPSVYPVYHAYPVKPVRLNLHSATTCHPLR